MALGKSDFVIAPELLSKVSNGLLLAGFKHDKLGGYMTMNQASMHIGLDIWCLKSPNKHGTARLQCADVPNEAMQRRDRTLQNEKILLLQETSGVMCTKVFLARF